MTNTKQLRPGIEAAVAVLAATADDFEGMAARLENEAYRTRRRNYFGSQSDADRQYRDAHQYHSRAALLRGQIQHIQALLQPSRTAKQLADDATEDHPFYCNPVEARRPR